MDKRFFLALFLSLIVIAVTQFLFPPAKPVAPARNAKDSTARAASRPASMGIAASSTPLSNASSTLVNGGGDTGLVPPTPAARQDSAVVQGEVTVVETPKAIYKFSNLGAAPTSVVIRDYKNRATNSIVDLGNPGAALLRYRVLSPSDTLDLARI